MIPKNNEIRFETTTKCNYNCIICARDKLTRKIETMSLNTFKTLLDKITTETSQYNTITFSGFGEPLLDKTITDKIKYAKSKNFKILILTNASFLTPEKFRELESIGVNSIRISFYGMSPESYSKIHNTTQFQRVKENIVEISKIKKTTKIILTYNIVKGINDHETDSWIKFWKPLVDLIEVWKPHNWVNGRTYRTIQPTKIPTCGRPWNTPLQIQVDGTVNMCCFDFNGKLLLGNLNTQSLSEIFSSEAFNKILHYHKTGNFAGSNLICENCDQRNSIKSDVMIFNSDSVDDRVNKLSTTYTDVNMAQK